MTTTLRDLIRFTMPPAGRLLASGDAAHVHVRGVAGLRATLPAFPELHGNDLALVSPAQALALDERLTLPSIIGRLSEIPVAAIAVLGPIDVESRDVASAAGIPLIELPAGTELRTVEKDALRLLQDADLQIERWAAQLYSDLTQLVVDGMGVAGVLRRFAEHTGLGVACYTPGGMLRAHQAQGSARAVFEVLRPSAPGEHQLLSQHVYVEPIADSGWLALAAPTLDRWDRLAARQAAAALALELAKEQAVKDAEARVRGDLVRTILSGTSVDMESLRSQAADLGYQLDQPHVALVISPAEETPSSLQPSIERLLNQRKLAAPVLGREDSLLVFVPVGSNVTATQTLLDTVKQGHVVTAGISGVAASVQHWARALDEAEQALALGRQLFGKGSVTAFSDLGVYRLLLAQRDSPELWRFYRDTLGPLLDHGSSGSDLIETLEGYFLARGNVSRAAALLHIHRNTLIYRLQRICEIAGVDWDRAEDQLALQLALKAHRVLRVAEPTSARV